MKETQYDQDLIVIGGGSGGLAAAKEAARLGARVTLFDFVTPTVHGTTWGVGGCCVNSGCIPKKLMHKAARLGESLRHDMIPFGWRVPAPCPKAGDDKVDGEDPMTDDATRSTEIGRDGEDENLSCNGLLNAHFDWEQCASTVQGYVRSLNFSYKSGLRSAQVTYVNALATIKDRHTVAYKLQASDSAESKTVTCKHLLVAVGGRPHVPADVPGAREFAYTSDDLFWLKKAPGKTLVVGGSYIALECAGFLTGMHFDCTVAVRSILLRGFDRGCAEKIGAIMKELGTRFLPSGTLPIKIGRVSTPAPNSADEKRASELLEVTFSDGRTETYDTVIYATGRLPSTQSGFELLKKTEDGHIIANANDETESGVFAVGDAVAQRPELTPAAVKAGQLLARRLFGNGKELMDYVHCPTTIFTPVEYGCCGLSEEDAIQKFGEENVETYLFEFNPIEVSAAHWQKSKAVQRDDFDTEISPINHSKLVCRLEKGRAEDGSENVREVVVGFHCIGLNAGEITQGYALAIKCGLDKKAFDSVIGIHPTDAESFHSLDVTRRSGANYVAAGGCGGGVCG